MCHDVSSEWNTFEDVFLKTENQKTGKMRHLKCSTNKKVRLHTHGCCSSQISILKIYHKTTPAIDSL